jgi:hypothetical protein
MSQRHPSDSTEQQLAEALVLSALNAKYHASMEPGRVVLGAGACIDVDGIDHNRNYMCEIYCRIGQLKPAQLHKVSSDILKLSLAENRLGGKWTKLIVFVDAKAQESVTGRSWRSAAAAQHGVEFVVVDLPPRTREEILAAQARQIMATPGGALMPNNSLERTREG